jgi:hypothetical protein
MSALDKQMKKHDESCNVEMRRLGLEDCDCGTREAIQELDDLRADLIQAIRHLEYIVCHGYMPDGGIDKLLEKYLDLEETE